ncbi:MAG: serine hydrolase domain-containing protein [bacterium]
MNRYRAMIVLLLLPSTLAVAQAPDVSVKLDSAMRVAERAGFSGVVRVQRAGTTLLEKGYGMANRAEKTPFTPATIVQIGSNTKDFTAVAILQLQQAGKLSMNDSIGKYFPNAPATKRDITIRQLMNHRAGFPLGIGGDFEPLSRAALVDSAMKTPPLFTPGTRESYSNTGYSLLAAIIEQVSGTTYDLYVQTQILAPLGMRRTGFLLPGFKANELAHGYRAQGTDAGTMLARPHASDGPYWNLRGNGGMLSTVGDMHVFYKGLFESDKLMTPATRALKFNPNEPIGLAGSDGVAFFLYDRFPGMQTEIIIASTNAAFKAPMIRREIGNVLGLPNPDGDTGEAVARRAGGKAAPAALTRVLTELVKAINSGDRAGLRKVISANFVTEAGGPTIDDRVERIGGIHESLGDITIQRIEMFDDGPFEMTLKSALQGVTVVSVMADRTEPYRIHGLRIRIGG